METVLIVGGSGNIGVSAIKATLRSGRNVIAVIRNEASKKKIIGHVGTSDGITFIEADVTDDHGIENVVEKVKSGDLPAFQHVFSTVGELNWTSPIQNLSLKDFRKVINTSLEANYLAYRATIPYLIEQGHKDSTWTLMTGGAADLGFAGVTAVSQGALVSMANVACLENINTNIRFNEIYLSTRVDYDSVAEAKGPQVAMSATQFSVVYEKILSNKDIDACRVKILKSEDVQDLKYEKKIPEWLRNNPKAIGN